MSHRPRIRGIRAAVGAATACLVAAALGVVVSADAGATAPSLKSAAAAKPKTPNTAKLAGGLAKQPLNWEACDFGDPATNDAYGNVKNLQCATVLVPLDWHNPAPDLDWRHPDGNTMMAVRISQVKNRKVTNGRYKGTIFINPGGPGAPGLPFSAYLAKKAPDLAPFYNFVGFDPRGVGQSGTPSCEFSFDYNAPDREKARLKAIAEACANDPVVSKVNTEQTAYDMDFVRYLLKAPKLSYIGYSYGTWLGAWYENVFGANADKVLLDSATDVTQPSLQRTWLEQPLARDRQFLRHMLPWIARHDDVYGLGTDPAAIHQQYFAGAAKLHPLMMQIMWFWSDAYKGFSRNAFYPASADVIKSIVELGKQQPGEDPAAAADVLLRRIQNAPSTTASARESIKEARQQLQALIALPARAADDAGDAGDASEPDIIGGSYNEPFDFIRCNDGQWTQRQSFWTSWANRTAVAAPFSASWGAVSENELCSYWRTEQQMPVADPATFPTTMVVQGELDSQTAYETGYDTGTKLPNTKLTVIDNEGSHGHFPYGTECVDERIFDFFLNGRLTGKDIQVCQAVPLPQETITYESWTKLNNRGKPTTPVGSIDTPAILKPGARTGAPLKLVFADPVAAAAFEESLRATYGERGVRVARRAGVL
ncbi:alpha/beta fold hydrolase [Nocardioides sp. GXZ039]|uniref:alpha/beta fold hydrolase n=1 Tax=Nocardioides sp. GXZ039 TaxID=3136018 RepID=UPI0030F38C01